MADVCRVDTDSLETAASDIDKEKPKLDNARTVVGGITLRGTDFGRVNQFGPPRPTPRRSDRSPSSMKRLPPNSPNSPTTSAPGRTSTKPRPTAPPNA